MNSVMLDRLELSFLNGLQDQRVAQNRVRSQTQTGIEAMRNSGMPAATASTPISSNGVAPISEDADAGGIINRSPTTNYHYYQQAPVQAVATPTPTPAPTPVPVSAGISLWWMIIPAALAIAAGTYLFWPKPTPAAPPAVITPGSTEDAQTTIILRDAP